MNRIFNLFFTFYLARICLSYPRASEKITKSIKVYDEFYVISEFDMSMDQLYVTLDSSPALCPKSNSAVRFPKITDTIITQNVQTINEKIEIFVNTTATLKKTFDIYTPYGGLCSCFYAIQLLDGCIFTDYSEQQVQLQNENNFSEQDAAREGLNQYLIRIPCSQSSQIRIKIVKEKNVKKYQIAF
jgi:hypothetical protein